MVKTYIPITQARANNFLPSAKKVQFGMVLLLAIMTGFFAGISSPSMIPTDPRSLLGAVSESKVATAPAINSESVSTAELALGVQPEEPTSPTAQNETFSAAQFFAPSVSTKSREELEQLIAASELSISQDTNEVTRIRNASVAIVSEFETNCGDWEDDCAVYYSRALERNNIVYSDLVLKIEREKHILEELRNEMSLL
jgi:hypothetical protein